MESEADDRKTPPFWKILFSEMGYIYFLYPGILKNL
jgi:hypothetical protein